MSTTIAPSNPNISKMKEIQVLGLEPYDRNPSDYLRFVAKVFSAYRDPKDTILNNDPFDQSYNPDSSEEQETSTYLQATTDKTIVSYIDGFHCDYGFVHLTTDEQSTDIQKADNDFIPPEEETSAPTVGGEVTESKYQKFHTFKILPGKAFVDNQLIEILEETNWFFRVPVYDLVDGEPVFNNTGQFIEDPVNIWSLLPDRDYRVILSYNFINQQEGSIARIRFVTKNTAIDEPYLQIATFTTDKYGRPHQSKPTNEKDTKDHLDYINIPDVNNQNRFYLRDINPQYLDKLYMRNHKNLFKHLRNQLLTVLSDSKIANTFHVRVIPENENIHLSVSSGDFVFWNHNENAWYPAEVSRQAHDKVSGLYLKNVREGTDLLFTSGIVEVNEDYRIFDKDNNILRNLIPGQEYFLMDDKDVLDDQAPWIAPFRIIDTRNANTEQTKELRINTDIKGLMDSIKIGIRNVKDVGTPYNDFLVSRVFDLTHESESLRAGNTLPLEWIFTEEEHETIPSLINVETGLVDTTKIEFKIEIKLNQDVIGEKDQEIIDDLQRTDIDLIVNANGSPLEINDSDFVIDTTGLQQRIIGNLEPAMELLDAFRTTAPRDYQELNLLKGDRFQDAHTNGVIDYGAIQTNFQFVSNTINDIITNDNPASWGLYNKISFMSDHKSDLIEKIDGWNKALVQLEEDYNQAKIEFGTEENQFLQEIKDAKDLRDQQKEELTKILQEIDSIQKQLIIIQAEIDKEQLKLDGNIEDKNTKTDLLTSIQGQKASTDSLKNDLQNTIDTLILERDQLILDISNTRDTLSDLFDSLVLEMHPFQWLDSKYRTFTTSVNTEPGFPALVLHSIRLYNLSLDQIEVFEAELKTMRDLYNNYDLQYQDIIINNGDQVTKIQLKNDLDETSEKIKWKEAELKEEIQDNINIINVLNGYYDRLEQEKAKPILILEGKFDSVNEVCDYTLYGKNNTEDITIKFSPVEGGMVQEMTLPAGTQSVTKKIDQDKYRDTQIVDGAPIWAAQNIVGGVVNLNEVNESLLGDERFYIVETDDNGSGSYSADIVKVSADLYDIYYQKLTEYKEADIGANGLRNLQLELSSKKIIIESENVRLSKFQNTSSQYQAAIDKINDELIVIDQNIIDLTSLIDIYTSSTNEIVGIVGTTKSKNVLIQEQNLNNSLKISKETELEISEETLRDLIESFEDAEDQATGAYTKGIAELNRDILDAEQQIDKIKILYEIFVSRAELVQSIKDSVDDLLASRLFELVEKLNVEGNSYSTINVFEYQDSMEKQLIELVEDSLKLPNTGVYKQAKLLTYVCTPMGLAYPNDLQPFIRVDSRGKITSRRYPGSTSVGIALNRNTLILNIRTNPDGDISEMLNVYGNAEDLYEQLVAKFKSEQLNTNYIKFNDGLQKVENTIDYLRTKLVTGSSLTTAENELIDDLNNTNDGKELLFLLASVKFMGKDTTIDSGGYIYDNLMTASKNGYWMKDNVNMIPTYNRIESLIQSLSLTQYKIDLLEGLFSNKINIYKEIAILSKILSVYSYTNYQDEIQSSKYNTEYKSRLQKKLLLKQLTLGDLPGVTDDFENEFITGTITEDNDKYQAEKEATQNEITNINNKIDAVKADHLDMVEGNGVVIERVLVYKSLIEDFNRAQEYYSMLKSKYLNVQNQLIIDIDKTLKEINLNENKINKLPNPMWDIFRITQYQRDRFNYTYLTLRIKGMLQELNNTVTDGIIQYSPINSEINEASAKYNNALNDGNVLEIAAFKSDLDAKELKKKQFTGLLQNHIDDYNSIAQRFNYPKIALDTESFQNQELFITDPTKYNLSYAFAPYPKYD